MAEVSWSDDAKSDLRSYYLRIARDSVTAAEKWRVGILHAVAALEAFPEIGPAVEEVAMAGLRELIVGPYRVLYRFDGARCRIGLVIRAERDLRRAFRPESFE